MIRFRPHHFLCTLGFQGEGYSPPFVENYQHIKHILQGPAGDETLIQIVSHADDICRACPHQRGVLCTEQAKIAALDARHAQALSLNKGQVLTWGAAKQKIATLISEEKFKEICEGCAWRDLGYCHQALKKLHQESSLKDFT